MARLTFQYLSRLPIMQEFYDLVWNLFQIRVVLRSCDGTMRVAMASPPSRSPFCTALRSQIKGEELCEECDRQHVRAAMEKRKSLQYHCHAGLTEFVIPIALGDEIIAFLVSGQILDEPPDEAAWKRVRRQLEASGVEAEPLRSSFFKIHSISRSIQKDLIAQLELFGNYVAYASDQMLLLDENRSSTIIARSTRFINSNFASRLTLSDVAEAACTSARNLRRVFRSEMGMTVLQYIQNVRIGNACEQLIKTSTTCSRIAYDSGFGSIQQFNVVFKKMRHITPMEWRRRFFS